MLELIRLGLRRVIVWIVRVLLARTEGVVLVHVGCLRGQCGQPYSSRVDRSWDIVHVLLRFQRPRQAPRWSMSRINIGIVAWVESRGGGQRENKQLTAERAAKPSSYGQIINSIRKERQRGPLVKLRR